MKVLQLSGGKDSIACLYLLKPEWDTLTVCWVNTGAAFPETVAYMDEVRALVPNFHEIKSQQTIAQDGYPADIFPVSRSTFGQLMEPSNKPRFQSRYICCATALWMPMAKEMKALGATVVIRGQKNSDKLQAPFQHGQVFDGIEYQFPLREWSDEDVYRYLHEHDIELPDNYRFMNTGLDCWNCSAYLHENVGKFEYMRERHPGKRAFMMQRLEELQLAVQQESDPLKTILECV